MTSIVAVVFDFVEFFQIDRFLSISYFDSLRYRVEADVSVTTLYDHPRAPFCSSSLNVSL